MTPTQTTILVLSLLTLIFGGLGVFFVARRKKQQQFKVKEKSLSVSQQPSIAPKEPLIPVKQPSVAPKPKIPVKQAISDTVSIVEIPDRLVIVVTLRSFGFNQRMNELQRNQDDISRAIQKITYSPIFNDLMELANSVQDESWVEKTVQIRDKKTGSYKSANISSKFSTGEVNHSHTFIIKH